jgi:hypothetical protein
MNFISSFFFSQMRMQAMSRNKASVAQDFHNAGGGEQNTQLFDKRTLKIEQPSPTKDQKQSPMAASPTTKTGKSPKTMSRYIKNSPPATEKSKLTHHQQSPNKKRRRNSHDKENTQKSTSLSPSKRHLLSEIKYENPILVYPTSTTTTTTTAAEANTNNKNFSSKLQGHKESKLGIEEKSTNIFDKLYKNSCKKLNTFSLDGQKQQLDKPKVVSTNFLIDELLKNNKEITIIPQQCNNNNNNDLKNANNFSATPSTQRTRKQEKPRKIEKVVDQQASRLDRLDDDPNSISSIRDKHLVRLVSSRGKNCRTCKNVNFYHSIASLILHKRWRHNLLQWRHKCGECKLKFNKRYQLYLHNRITHKIK